MTEYDYSPDAVERFQAKMEGVGRWASEQRYHAPKYSNPFLPQGDQASSSYQPHTTARQDAYARPSERSTPTRSRTLPAHATGAGGGYGQTSRALAYAQQSDSSSSSPSRGHHRSGSQPVDPRRAQTIPAPVAYGGHQSSRTSPVVYAAPHQYPQVVPGGRHAVMEYQYTHGQPIVLPQPRRGEQFVIIPPKGGRVDIVHPDGRSHSSQHSRSSSRAYGGRSKESSPTKKTADPLLKRLFTGLTPNIEWGSDASRSSSRRDGSRRRSASR